MVVESKTFNFLASLRSEVDEILEIHSENQQYNFKALSTALELSFRENSTRNMAAFNWNPDLRPCESLQELVAFFLETTLYIILGLWI